MKYTPQLATLVKEPPSGDEWLHELKYDGYRIGCSIDGRTVRLISRNGKDWTDHFAPVRDAAAQLKVKRALLDGEVAAVLPDGRTSFQSLQNALGGSEAHLVYFVFDLLHLDGENIARLPLEERKGRLQKLLGKGKGVFRYSDHVVGHGDRVFAAACRQQAEGIVSKRRDRPYQAGRGPSWVKTKCVQRQEFIIGGYTDPEGARTGIGALLVGVRDGARLVYAGKVGTGFSNASLRDLRQRLDALAQPDCPFAERPPGKLGRTAHWVRPELVGEVAFTEWTADGSLRHPSFQGLRADKKPADVIRERPAVVHEQRIQKSSRRHPESGGRRAVGAAAKSRKQASAQDPRVRVSEGSSKTSSPKQSGSKGEVTVAGVTLSHPDRVLYPDLGLTKLDLARFYEAIGEWIVPHVAGRPLTLVRCPQGIGPSCFYMKHTNVAVSTGMRRIKIREKTKVGEYLIADSPAAVVALAQINVLEIHTWNSTERHLEKPDRVVFDLDPGPAVDWPAIVDAARLIRTALEQLELQSFVKTTGGRGVHVVVPLEPVSGWDECLEFSRALAEAVVRLDPRTYTTNFTKAGRERQILIDYKRNNRGSTSVAAFSTRARPGAPVSVPLAWDELTARLRSDHFTVRNLAKRLATLRVDPWKKYWSIAQRLSADATRRLEAVQ